MRQLFEAGVADASRERALAGAAAPAARGVRGARPGATARRGRVVRRPARALLAHAQPRRPSGRCCSPSTTCTGATGRRCASSPTSRAGSRARRCSSPATLRTSEPGDRPGAARPRSPHDPATRAAAPRPARARRRSPTLVRARLGDDADAGVLRRLPRRDRRQPAAAAPAAARARGRGRRARRRRTPTSCAAIGPRAVSQHRAAAARAAARPTPPPSPAPSPCSARAPTLPASPRWPGSTSERWPAATGALARAEILRPEPPLGFVHPLVRDAVYHELPPGERELQHARAARGAARARRADRAGRRAAAARAAPRRAVGRRAAARRAGAAPCAAARPTARSPTCARALEEPPPPERRGRRCCSSSGRPRRSRSGPAARRAPARGLRRARRPARARADRGVLLAQHAALHRPRRRGGARRRAARAADAAGGRWPTSRRALEALELTTVYFGARRRRGAELARPRARHRRPAPALGDRARMAAAVAGLDAPRRSAPTSAPRSRCAALEDGELIAADQRRLGLDRADGHARAAPTARRRSPSSTRCAPRPTAAARCSRSRRRTCGAASRCYAAATSPEAEERCAPRGRERRAVGLRRRGLAHVPRRHPRRTILVERGDVDGRARARSAAPRATPGHDGARFWLLRAARAARGRRARDEAAVAAADEIAARVPGVDEPGAQPVALAAARRRSTRLGRARRGARARRRGARAGPRLGRAGRARPGAARARRARAGDARASPGSRRPSRCSTARRRGWSSPRRWPRSAPRCAATRRPADAREPLRRALELAARCGAPALAEHVRTELYAAGARPRTDALTRRRAR